MEIWFYRVATGVLAVTVGVLLAALDSPTAYGLKNIWEDFGGLFVSLAAFLFAYYLALNATRMAIEMQRRTKISEFRQNWINDLRQYVSELIAFRLPSKTGIEVAARSNALVSRIRLRLNPDEPFAEEMRNAVWELCNAGNDDEYHVAANELSRITQMYLKAEWERLKEELSETQ